MLVSSVVVVSLLESNSALAAQCSRYNISFCSGKLVYCGAFACALHKVPETHLSRGVSDGSKLFVVGGVVAGVSGVIVAVVVVGIEGWGVIDIGVVVGEAVG